MIVNDIEVTGHAAFAAVPNAQRDRINSRAAKFLIHKHAIFPLIRKMIHSEISEAKEQGTLFRSNSPVCNLMSAHAKLIGRSFLQKTLRPLVVHLCDSVKNGHHFEV